jgi:hypothetical protein
MAKQLPYAAWVRQQLERLPEDQRQAARGAYYSESGRIAKWDVYKADCKAMGLGYDNPPEGYWESKEQPWHKAAGYAMGLVGLFLWVMAQIISGSTGMKRK